VWVPQQLSLNPPERKPSYKHFRVWATYAISMKARATMLEQPPKLKDPAFWAYALRYALMWTMAVVAAIGFSRFLNTLLRRGILFELDFPAWLPTYLMVSGFVQLVLGMIAYIALKENRTWHLPFLW